MPNFPSIYLELQELWKRLRGIADNIKTIEDDIVDGVPPSGPAGGVLRGQYPNPDGIGANDGLETINLYCFNSSVLFILFSDILYTLYINKYVSLITS